MKGSQSALWFDVSVKVMVILNKQKRRARIKLSARGKSSNQFAALYISAYLHKPFDSWKLSCLHPPSESCLSHTLSIHLSVSVCLTGSSKKQREKSDFHITDCYFCHYILWFTQSQRGGRQMHFHCLQSHPQPPPPAHMPMHTKPFTRTLRHTSAVQVKFLSRQYTPTEK